MAFRVGQKVVCINDDWILVNSNNKKRQPKCPVKRGSVYSVASVENGGFTYFLGNPSNESIGLRLVGVNNKASPSGSLNANRFRPIIDTSKEVEKLKQLARNPKVMA